MKVLRLWLAAMGAVQTIVGGLGVLQLLPDKTVGLLALIVAGLHVGTALYVSPSPYSATPPAPPAQPAVVTVNTAGPMQTTPPAG